MFTPYPIGSSRRRQTPALSDRARALLVEVERDWRMVTGAEPAEIDPVAGPVDLSEALPYCFVLGRNGEGVLRVRVAGQRLHEILRHDPRGAPFGTFFADDARETVDSLLETVLETPAIMELPLVAYRGLTRRPVSASLLALPLRDGDGRIAKIMGALVPSETEIGGASLRFDLATDRILRHEPLEHGLVERRRANRTVTQSDARPRLRLVVDNG